MKNVHVKNIDERVLEMGLEDGLLVEVPLEDFYGRLRKLIENDKLSELSLIGNTLFVTHISIAGNAIVEHREQFVFDRMSPKINSLIEYYLEKAGHIKERIEEHAKRFYGIKVVKAAKDVLTNEQVRILKTKEEFAFARDMILEEEDFFKKHAIVSSDMSRINKAYAKLSIIIGIVGLSAIFGGLSMGVSSGLISTLSSAGLLGGAHLLYKKVQANIEKQDREKALARFRNLYENAPWGETLQDEERELFAFDPIVSRIKKALELIDKNPYGDHKDLSSRMTGLLGEYKTAVRAYQLFGKKYNCDAILTRLCHLELEYFSLNARKGLIREPGLDSSAYGLAMTSLQAKLDDDEGTLRPFINAKEIAVKIYEKPYEGCEVHLLKIFLAMQEYVLAVNGGDDQGLNEAKRHFLYAIRTIGNDSAKSLLDAELADESELTRNQAVAQIEEGKSFGGKKA